MKSLETKRQGLFFFCFVFLIKVIIVLLIFWRRLTGDAKTGNRQESY